MTFFISIFEVLLAVTVLLLYFTFVYKRRDPRYPPGPAGLPLIGGIHQFAKCPHLILMKWFKEYGKNYSIKFGLDDAVVLNDPKLIKELFNDMASTGRVKNDVFLAISDGPYGIINAEGQAWEEQRRFALRRLRDFGFAKSSMEDFPYKGMILDEVTDVLDWFDQTKGTPISCNRLFNAVVVNSLWHIVSGKREKLNVNNLQESQILRMSERLLNSIDHAITSGLVFAPFLRLIALGLSGWTNDMKVTTDLNRANDKEILEHKQKLNPDMPQDLIDYYLVEMDMAKDPKTSCFQSVRGKFDAFINIAEDDPFFGN